MSFIFLKFLKRKEIVVFTCHGSGKNNRVWKIKCLVQVEVHILVAYRLNSKEQCRKSFLFHRTYFGS